MYLTLDIGNTRIKYAQWLQTGVLLSQGEVNRVEELPVAVNAVAYCNVRNGGPLQWSDFKGKMLEVNSRIKLPFKMEYKTPDTLGQDRIAAIAGASKLYAGRDVLVVDAGTCIKFDLLTANGTYRGGSISPGLIMRYKALNHFTGRLPEVTHSNWQPIWGASTEESILAGVQHGYVGEANHRIAQFTLDFPNLLVVLTGGDAPFLADRLKTRIFAEPLLIHHGLLHCLLNQ